MFVLSSHREHKSTSWLLRVESAFSKERERERQQRLDSTVGGEWLPYSPLLVCDVNVKRETLIEELKVWERRASLSVFESPCACESVCLDSSSVLQSCNALCVCVCANVPWCYSGAPSPLFFFFFSFIAHCYITASAAEEEHCRGFTHTHTHRSTFIFGHF